MTLGTQSVSGAPIAQYHRKAQSVPVQDRPISTSFPSLEGPVNHPEAEYATQFCNAHFRLASRQIDLVLIFPRGSMRTMKRLREFVSVFVAYRKHHSTGYAARIAFDCAFLGRPF